MNNRDIINEFIKYCKLDKDLLKIEVFEELKKYYKKLKFGDGFILAKGDIPLMLVAHMDTVHLRQCDDSNIFVNINENIVTSSFGIGGDDRCGIFMIMDIIKKTKHRPYILFTEDEEKGGIGAKKFIKRYNATNTHINYMIELDRANANDSVYYDLDDKVFEAHINKYGFKTAIGSYSDICDLCPAFDCAGVNLSCGYYKAHTTSEYVNINEMLSTIYKVVRILNDFKDSDDFKWKEKTYYYCSNLYDTWEFSTYQDYDKDEYKGYTIYDCCDYCGLTFPMKDLHLTEDGSSYVCEECMKKYGLTQCVECGTAMYYGSTSNLCEDCKRWNSKMLEKGRIDV